MKGGKMIDIKRIKEAQHESGCQRIFYELVKLPLGLFIISPWTGYMSQRLHSLDDIKNQMRILRFFE